VSERGSSADDQELGPYGRRCGSPDEAPVRQRLPAAPWWPAGSETWEVADDEMSISVAGRPVPWAPIVLCWVVLAPFLVLLTWPAGWEGLRGPAPVFASLLGLVTWAGRRDQTFLRADERGLHIRTNFFILRFRIVPWDEVAGFWTQQFARSWANETWSVATVAGERVLITPIRMRNTPRPYQELRQIMVGVARVPLRFGRPAVPIDGGPGPTAHGHLPPPPEPRP